MVTKTLGGNPVGVFYLAGQRGQILSHSARLWVRPTTGGGANVLLRLRPAGPPFRAEAIRNGNFMSIEIPGPLGPVCEVWEEVPMVELPQLLRIMMGADSNGGALALQGDN